MWTNIPIVPRRAACYETLCSSMLMLYHDSPEKEFKLKSHLYRIKPHNCHIRHTFTEINEFLPDLSYVDELSELVCTVV